MEKPSAAIAAKAPISVTGTVGGGHEHRPPVLKEDEDDDQHQNGRLDQRPIDLEDRGPHEFRRVVGDDVRRPSGKLLASSSIFALTSLATLDGVGFRQQGDGDAGGRPAVEVERLAVGLSAELDRPTSRTLVICPPFAGSTLTMMFSNSAGSSSRPVRLSVYWKSWPFGAGGAPTWPGRHLLALLLDDADDVLRRQPPRLKQVRVQPDAHGVLPGAEHGDVADAVEAASSSCTLMTA